MDRVQKLHRTLSSQEGNENLLMIQDASRDNATNMANTRIRENNRFWATNYKGLILNLNIFLAYFVLFIRIPERVAKYRKRFVCFYSSYIKIHH